jgi:hypothetical protein
VPRRTARRRRRSAPQARRAVRAAAAAAAAMLAQQSFTGNPLCRLSDVPARFRASSRPDNEVSLVVVSGREVVVRSPTGAFGPGVHQDLQARSAGGERRLAGVWRAAAAGLS